MASIFATRRGPAIVIEKLGSMAPHGTAGLTMTDADGAVFVLNGDVVAHIVSMAFHAVDNKASLEDVLAKWCTCVK